MNRRLHATLALAIFAFASIVMLVPASAQSIYGSIFGTVKDKSGAIVPGATITVKDVAKGTVISVVSNASGDYSVSHLIPDTYDIRISAKGFKNFETKGIDVLADTAPRVDAEMQVGGASETIEVSADQEPMLKTDRADVATVFNEQQVQNLPVGDQNFTNLQMLIPGAQKLSWSHAASENPQASQQIMVNGQSFAGSAFELDGTDNEDPVLGIIVINPSMDAVTETKITTQNFDAELGKAVSAVVTAQTRSGSNKLHGTLYDFRTSNANEARDPFSVAPGALPSGLKNRMGASIGGPAIKDKLFFFFNYEGQRQKVGTSATSTVPTALLTETALGNKTATDGSSGVDFSEYLTAYGAKGQLYDTTDPYTDSQGRTRYQPFDGNIVPRSYFATDASKPALALLKVLEPYTTGVAYESADSKYGLDSNFHGTGTGLFNSDQWTERVDYTLSPTAHAFERFSRFTDTLTGKRMFGDAGGPGYGINNYGGTSQGANDSLASGMDIAVKPTILTDFRLAYYRYNIRTHKADQDTEYATTLGIPNENLGDYYTGGSPSFFFDTLPSGGTQPVYGDDLSVNRCNCPLTEKEDQGQIVNNWTFIHGDHAVKVGVDLRYARNLRVPSDTNRTGKMSFSTGPTSDPSNPTAAGGLGFATFLMGDVTSFGRFSSVSTNAKEFQKRTFFYAQDTWRATHNLTLNIGLRWELYFPEVTNGKEHGALLSMTDGYLHVAGVGGVPTNMDSKIDKSQMFAPRLGINYQLNPKTVIRAGYGRTFDIGVFGSIFGHVVTQNIPVLSNQQINADTTIDSAFKLNVGPTSVTSMTVPSNGLLPNPGADVNSKSRPDTLRFPTIDAWNLAVQRSLTPTMSLTLAYVGNKGTHNLGDTNGNTTNPNEAAINLPASFSATGQALHYDSTVASGEIASDGGTSTTNFLRRYYGGSLKACQDSNYTMPTGNYLSNGMCGWTDDITYYANNQNTEFEALQVTLQEQGWKGLNYSLNYQWASSFADSTGFSTWDQKSVRGRDSNLRRQSLVWYGTYDLPFGRGKQFFPGANKLTNLFIGGYQLSGSFNLSSGLPFTLSYAEASTNLPGDAPSYPSYSGSARMKTHLTKYVPSTNSDGTSKGTGTRTYYDAQSSNILTDSGTGIFKNPGAGVIGNVGRNTYFGPSFFNSDIAVSKDFNIYKTLVARFRMDAFNAFNHINPSNPGGAIESPGSISSLANGSTPRQLEFSMHLQF